jgi:hypothetical protein
MEANSEELSKIPEADWLFGNRENQGVLISDSNPVSNFCRRASRLYPRVRTTINDEHRPDCVVFDWQVSVFFRFRHTGQPEKGPLRTSLRSWQRRLDRLRPGAEGDQSRHKAVVADPSRIDGQCKRSSRRCKRYNSRSDRTAERRENQHLPIGCPEK